MIRRDIPKKTKQIGIRFSEDEKRVVERYVQDHTRAESVSEWIRELVFREMEKQEEKDGESEEGTVARIGVTD